MPNDKSNNDPGNDKSDGSFVEALDDEATEGNADEETSVAAASDDSDLATEGGEDDGSATNA